MKARWALRPTSLTISFGDVLVFLVTCDIPVWGRRGVGGTPKQWFPVHCFVLCSTLPTWFVVSCLPWCCFPLVGKDHGFQFHARPWSRYWRDKDIDPLYKEDHHLLSLCLFLSLHFTFLHILRRFTGSLYMPVKLFKFQIFLNFKLHFYSCYT